MSHVLDLQQPTPPPDRRADFGGNPKGADRLEVKLLKGLKAAGAAPKSKSELKKLLQDLGIGLVTRPRAAPSPYGQSAPSRQPVPEKPEALMAEGAIQQSAFDPVQEGLKVLDRMREAEGGSMTGAELLKRYDLTSATLHRRRKEHRIVFWQDAKHDFHYPVWQFTATGSLLPGIQEVLQLFRSGDTARIMRYFLGRRKQLEDKTPLECLRAGEKSTVTEHASRHYAENTW